MPPVLTKLRCMYRGSVDRGGAGWGQIMQVLRYVDLKSDWESYWYCWEHTAVSQLCRGPVFKWARTMGPLDRAGRQPVTDGLLTGAGIRCKIGTHGLQALVTWCSLNIKRTSTPLYRPLDIKNRINKASNNKQNKLLKCCFRPWLNQQLPLFILRLRLTWARWAACTNCDTRIEILSLVGSFITRFLDISIWLYKSLVDVDI